MFFSDCYKIAKQGSLTAIHYSVYQTWDKYSIQCTCIEGQMLTDSLTLSTDRYIHFTPLSITQTSDDLSHEVVNDVLERRKKYNYVLF